MRGLLLKDWYVLRGQLWNMGLLILLFSVLPGAMMPSFAFVYSAMMPVSLLSYDERSKWDRLAAAMPIDRKTFVLEKYVLGLLYLTAPLVLGTVSRLVYAAVSQSAFSFAPQLIGLAAGMAFQALIMPFIFRFGSEKGRMAYLIGVGLIMGGLFVIVNIVGFDEVMMGNLTPSSGLMALVAPCLLAISALLSIKFYREKEL